MIRVTVEILPFGFERGKRTLAIMEIINTGTGTKQIGDYVFKIYNKAGRFWKNGAVTDYPRQSLSVLHLVLRCLKAAFPSETAEELENEELKGIEE